jgi:DNA-binding NarL/FixJ family response regulator
MKKILIIEDDPALRGNTAKILSLENYQAATASNGLEGVEAVRRDPPDLILCDILMPGLDGLHVLANLRSDPATARIPFIFLTAKGELSDLRAGMNLGADDYLIKPVHADDLLAAVEARLERIQKFAGSNIDFSSPKPLEALGLSNREAQILLLVAQGETNKELGDLLGISAGTVRKHLENIYRKLSVTTRNAAARRAVEVLPSRQR